MLSSSSFSYGLRFWRTTDIMAEFYHLYLPSILQMRSGDIETNPGPNTPESAVSEEELILLSEHIDPDKYFQLGYHLGIPYALPEYMNIHVQPHDDYKDAIMEVFIKWRNKQLPGTNTKAILAEELQTCGLGELSGRLLDGSLISNTTSKPLVPFTSSPSPTHEPLPLEQIQKCAEDFNRSTVSEEELILLSENIPLYKYLRLGIRLGIPYAVLKEIRIQYGYYIDVIMEVLMRWNSKLPPGTNTRAILAEELQTCGFGELSGRLLDGIFASYTTSKRSVPSASSSSPTQKPLPSELIQKCAEDFKKTYSTVNEEELILLSGRVEINKYLRLGIRLGMPYAVLKEIKIQSNNDYRDAIMEVFMRWNIKQLPGTNTRAILAEELQTCGLGGLSGCLLDGSLLSNTTSKPSVPSTSSPSPTHEALPSELIQKCAEDFKTTYSTVSDKELFLLSEHMPPNQYLRLGIRLGIPYAVLKEIKIQSHDDYNDAFIQVFTKWRNKQLPGKNIRAILHEELQTCHLGGLSRSLLYGSCLSITTSKPSVPSTSSPSPTHEPLPLELIQKCAEDFKTTYSAVSDEEFFLLSELIDPSEYLHLGVCLGIPNAVLNSIKRRSNDDSDALLQVFMKWNIKQLQGTNTRAILAEELQTCGLGELSGKLLDGSLLSNTTSKEFSSVQEARNQDGGSDDKGSRDLLDTSLYQSETQKYSELLSLSAQVADKTQSPQPTESIPSSLIQAPQSTAVLHHSHTQPLPHQGTDLCTSMPTFTHHPPRSDDEFASLPATDTSHSEDSILDLTCTSEYVDSGGKVLSIPSYGFILSIPPGALEGGEWITCKALPSLPDNLELNPDELIVSPGYRCYPSGLHFNKPAKLVIPHCGVFNDPSRVRTVLIPTDSQSTGEFFRTPLTQDVCKVNHNHFELTLQHFSGGHVIVLYDKSAVKGKHMLCMPYLEKIMPTSRIPIMEFCLRNKPHDPALIETHRTDHITQYVKDEEDEIFVKYKDLEVNCLLDEDEINKTISYRVLFSKPKHQEYFHLNLNRKANDSSVKLELLQETEKIQEILFRTRFTGVTPFSSGDPEEQSQSSSLQESSSTTRSLKREAPCTESTVTDNISGIPEKQMQLSRPSSDHHQTCNPTPGVSSSAVDPKEKSKQPREVSYREYIGLSSKIGPTGFYLIGDQLDASYAECKAVLVENGKNYANALLDLFMTWNIQQQQEHTDIREVLADKLVKSKLGMLADELRRGCLV